MPTPLTMHETKAVAQHLQFGGHKSMFISRSYPMNQCPYPVGAGLDLVAHGTKQVIARALVKSIRPVAWVDKSADDAMAKAEGFTNAKGWVNHWLTNFGQNVASHKKKTIFRLQLEILPIERPKPNIGDML